MLVNYQSFHLQSQNVTWIQIVVQGCHAVMEYVKVIFDEKLNYNRRDMYYFKSKHLLRIMNHFHILYTLNNDCCSHITIRINRHNNAR